MNRGEVGAASCCFTEVHPQDVDSEWVAGCLLRVKILLIFTPNALCYTELLQVGEGKKPKLGEVRACARGIFRRFPRPRFLRQRGGRPRMGAMDGKLPDKLEKCPRLELRAPSFSVGTALTQRAQGLLGDFAS